MKPVYLSIAKAAALAILAIVFLVTDLPLFMIGSDAASELIAPRPWVQILAVLVCAVALWLPVRAAVRIALVALAVVAILLGGHRLVIDNLHHRLADVYLGVPVQVLPLDPRSEETLGSQWGSLGFFIGPRSNVKGLFILSPGALGLDRDNVIRWTS